MNSDSVIQGAFDTSILYSNELNAALESYQSIRLIPEMPAEAKVQTLSLIAKHILEFLDSDSILNQLSGPLIKKKLEQLKIEIAEEFFHFLPDDESYAAPRQDTDAPVFVPPQTDTYDDFKKAISEDFLQLLQSPTFQNLISFNLDKLSQSNQSHLLIRPIKEAYSACVTGIEKDPDGSMITQNKQNKANTGRTAEPTIYIDSTNEDFSEESSADQIKDPRKIALAHEFIHTMHYLHGVRFTDQTLVGTTTARDLISQHRTLYSHATPDDIPTLGLEDHPADFPINFPDLP